MRKGRPSPLYRTLQVVLRYSELYCCRSVHENFTALILSLALNCSARGRRSRSNSDLEYLSFKVGKQDLLFPATVPLQDIGDPTPDRVRWCDASRSFSGFFPALDAFRIFQAISFTRVFVLSEDPDHPFVIAGSTLHTLECMEKACKHPPQCCGSRSAE